MLNKVILMGRLTKPPELKYTPSNVPVCSFSIAVERKFAKQGEDKQTDFINIVTWRNQAEFVSKYFVKGQMINVVGSIQTRKYENNGTTHYVTEVVADEINFCGDKKSSESQTFNGDDEALKQEIESFKNDYPDAVDDEDLPF